MKYYVNKYNRYGVPWIGSDLFTSFGDAYEKALDINKTDISVYVCTYCIDTDKMGFYSRVLTESEKENLEAVLKTRGDGI